MEFKVIGPMFKRPDILTATTDEEIREAIYWAGIPSRIPMSEEELRAQGVDTCKFCGRTMDTDYIAYDCQYGSICETCIENFEFEDLDELDIIIRDYNPENQKGE